RRNPGSETAGSLCCTRQQDIVQLGALDRHVRADIAPELFKIDLAEHVALLIAEQPSAHKPTRFFDSFAKAELVKHADGVGLHGNTAANWGPFQLAFDEFCRKASLAQGGCQAEARDAATRNQNAFAAGHLSRSSNAQSCRGRPRVSGPNQMA